jgi:hypothetical protein
MDAMAKLCKLRLQEFGAAGNASKIKRVLSTAEMTKRYASGELDPKFAGPIRRWSQLSNAPRRRCIVSISWLRSPCVA